jgi:OOP family OmpA-OmpF porin
VLVRHADDPNLARALTPPLERAITSSVKRNPRPLADALFPVMGPAIRKAVAASLASMIESLNRTLEHAVSWRSLQWRLEALRTGRSFAEVVVLKTLLYRVEQVFLIERRSGLLLLHVQAGSLPVQDADMVSGMLTAIRDFAQDSFRVADSESLEALKVGDLSVWIEPGPYALLAAVIRGTAPKELRSELQEALEAIHLQYGRVLESFAGDTSALEGARPILEGCLTLQYRVEKRPALARGAWIMFGVVLAAIAIWIGLSYRANARFARYLDAIRNEPGITVISSGRRAGRFVVAGLRDPLARDPQALLAPAGLSAGDVEARWAPYQALDPPLILERARRILQPPEGVRLELANGVLSAAGAASPAWVVEARRLAPLIGGVTSFDAAGALDAARRDIAARIERLALLFQKGSTQMVDGQDGARGDLVAGVGDLDALAGAMGERFAVEIVGHADSDGADEANLPLSRMRAEAVLAMVRIEALPHLTFTTLGVGSRQPAVSGETEADNQRNRRVTVRVGRPTGRRP